LRLLEVGDVVDDRVGFDSIISRAGSKLLFKDDNKTTAFVGFDLVVVCDGAVDGRKVPPPFPAIVLPAYSGGTAPKLKSCGITCLSTASILSINSAVERYLL
jgi:hypothetical protein